jgi:hypothetical protein
MKTKAFLLASILTILMCGVMIIRAQSFQTESISKTPQSVLDGPVVDYAGPNSPDTNADINLTGTERDKRHAKSASYDRANSTPIKEDAGTAPLSLNSHWWLHLPALPVTQSDAIAIGNVTGSRAFLSADKHAVYSEFPLQVEQILKDSTQSISVGASITTTRFGGIVRFPSGRKYVYQISRQAWPATGSRYILFLRKGLTGDFDIVTGYELRNGTAQPLDGTDLPGALPFQKYAGASETDLLEAIRIALAASAQGEHN